MTMKVFQLCAGGTNLKMCADQRTFKFCEPVCPATLEDCPSSLVVTISGFTQVDCARNNEENATYTLKSDGGWWRYETDTSLNYIQCSSGFWIFQPYAALNSIVLGTSDGTDCVPTGTFVKTNFLCGGATNTITITIS